MPNPSTTRQVADSDRLSTPYPPIASSARDDAQAQLKALINALEAHLAGFDDMDWEAAAAQDPEHAAELWRQFQGLRQALDHAYAEADHADHRRALETHQRRGARLADAHAELARELPEWSPQMAARLASFAQQAFGFAPEELAGVDDPRVVKLLHQALAGPQGSSRRADVAPDTPDFPAFETLADAKLKRA